MKTEELGETLRVNIARKNLKMRAITEKTGYNSRTLLNLTKHNEATLQIKQFCALLGILDLEVKEKD